jgi:hypothetical protein
MGASLWHILCALLLLVEAMGLVGPCFKLKFKLEVQLLLQICKLNSSICTVGGLRCKAAGDPKAKKYT